MILNKQTLLSCLCCCALLACNTDHSHSQSGPPDSSLDASGHNIPDHSPAADAQVPDSQAVIDDMDPVQLPIHLPAEPQRAGDPMLGYELLVNAPYVTCGVPARIFDQLRGPVPESLKLPGRQGANIDRAFFETEFTNDDDIQIVSTNCLFCHAGVIDGRLVVGLGNEASDFTQDTGGPAIASRALAVGDAELRALTKWSERVATVAPFVTLDTVGVNPADNLTIALIAHRDRHTLAWSTDPILDIPTDVEIVPLSVPPWWHMKKKNAMFYTAVGRGDHARFMMTASTLCTDTVDEARMIDEWFPHIRAYIASIEPPAYPGAIDQDKADQGRRVFEANCARCHGTYGADWTYPNLLIPMDEIGTDDVLARRSFNAAGEYIEWYNQSFYGELARATPGEGYVAPPLDGIWATAPYFHNGSVPTLAGVIKSAARPRFWSRFIDNAGQYDHEAVGWIHTVFEHGKDGAANSNERKNIYDTSRPGYGNTGHLYGDELSDTERAQLLEYLKTL